jgi:hypothetical protein
MFTCTGIDWELSWPFVGKLCTAVGAVLLLGGGGCMRQPEDAFASKRRFSLR